MTIANIVGWAGTAAILAAYTGNSFGVLSTHTVLSYALNGLGAAALALISWQKKAYQPLALNVIWACIAFFGVLSMVYGR